MMVLDLSPREAATRLGVSAETMRFYCRNGRIGRRLLGRYRISLAEVEQIEAGARVPSPPAKAAAHALDHASAP